MKSSMAWSFINYRLIVDQSHLIERLQISNAMIQEEVIYEASFEKKNLWTITRTLSVLLRFQNDERDILLVAWFWQTSFYQKRFQFKQKPININCFVLFDSETSKLKMWKNAHVVRTHNNAGKISMALK